jgi:hypothetical protein
MPRTHPTIWRRAVRSERVLDALRLKKGELELRRFIQEENDKFLMRAFGLRRPGGRALLSPYLVVDQVSLMRSMVFGTGSELPVDVDVEVGPDGDVLVLRVPPWITTRSVARLFALFRKNYWMNEGVDCRARLREKSLTLYQMVTNWREEMGGTWAETMKVWNDYVARHGKPWPAYAHVSNFHRDYHHVKRVLEARSRPVESASRSALGARGKKNSAPP